MIDPMLVILAPPAAVFGWAMIQIHKEPRPEPATATVESAD
jgi:hypothetical protein